MVFIPYFIHVVVDVIVVIALDVAIAAATIAMTLFHFVRVLLLKNEPEFYLGRTSRFTVIDKTEVQTPILFLLFFLFCLILFRFVRSSVYFYMLHI